MLTGIAWAQDDLLSEVDKQVQEDITYTAYTFKSTRIINGHSVEVMKKNQLDFRINHRFGELNTGAYELFGLDNALVNFSLEYGLTDRFNIGVRRGTYQKAYDGSVKYLFLRQCSGKRNVPVTITYFSDLSVNTLKITNPAQKNDFTNRLAYVHQLLIARKFNDYISLQLTPSFVHRNQVKDVEDNDTYGCGFGGRYKFSRRMAFTFEGFYVTLNSKSGCQYPLALGFDIETGGHVFQLFVTNSRPMLEKGMLAETTGDITKGGLYLGFNISRVYAFGKNTDK